MTPLRGVISRDVKKSFFIFYLVITWRGRNGNTSMCIFVCIAHTHTHKHTLTHTQDFQPLKMTWSQGGVRVRTAVPSSMLGVCVCVCVCVCV
jgi:hypothetical protein